MYVEPERAIMPVDPNLRKRIRILLAEHDITQKELAVRTGLREMTISNLVRGRTSDVNLSTLESIARALGCHLKVLIEDAQD